jgi:hypothetical protein
MGEAGRPAARIEALGTRKAVQRKEECRDLMGSCLEALRLWERFAVLG